MSNKEFLVLIFIVITKSYGFSFNECNRTHPDYDDSSCRKLWKPENRLHKFLLKYNSLKTLKMANKILTYTGFLEITIVILDRLRETILRVLKWIYYLKKYQIS